MKILKSLAYLAAALLVACSTGHCRRDGTKVPEKEDVKPPTGYQAKDMGTVMVAKSDGSTQCGMSPGQSLAVMKKELTGLQIISQKKVHDGMMRVQVCGAGTGMLNVYEIQRADISKALSKGFSEYKK